MADTHGQEPLESRLYRVYRYSMYAFGLVVGLGLIGGTWYGLQLVQKHDQSHQVTRKITNQVQRTAVANPFRHAKTVKITLPYRHGADAYTLNYLNQLSQHKVAALPGGFQVAGSYHSGNIAHETQLKLSCKDGFCQLSFELPAGLVLAPRYENGKLVKPQRQFELQSHGLALEVHQSRLEGVRLLTQDKLAAFNAPEELGRYYREDFFDHQGLAIQP